MSRRSKRLRCARPCYSCGFVARHYTKNGGAEGKADPCSCQACLVMPQSWRDELRKEWSRKVVDRKYHNAFNQRYAQKYHTPWKRDDSPIEPAELDAYTSLGCYPIVYYINGDSVCGTCIMSLLRGSYISEHDRRHMLRDVYYEGPAQECIECGELIESAYGDPDEPNEEEEDSETSDKLDVVSLFDAKHGVDAGAYTVIDPETGNVISEPKKT